jgi:hypothetical protein
LKVRSKLVAAVASLWVDLGAIRMALRWAAADEFVGRWRAETERERPRVAVVSAPAVASGACPWPELAKVGSTGHTGLGNAAKALREQADAAARNELALKVRHCRRSVGRTCLLACSTVFLSRDAGAECCPTVLSALCSGLLHVASVVCSVLACYSKHQARAQCVERMAG